MTFHQAELRAAKEECAEECVLTKSVYNTRNEKRKNDDRRRRLNNIADGICVAFIGIGVYFTLYGIAAFLQWCSTGTWI